MESGDLFSGDMYGYVSFREEICWLAIRLAF